MGISDGASGSSIQFFLLSLLSRRDFLRDFEVGAVGVGVSCFRGFLPNNTVVRLLTPVGVMVSLFSVEVVDELVLSVTSSAAGVSEDIKLVTIILVLHLVTTY